MAQHWRLYVSMLHRNLQGIQRDMELLSPGRCFCTRRPPISPTQKRRRQRRAHGRRCKQPYPSTPVWRNCRRFTVTWKRPFINCKQPWKRPFLAQLAAASQWCTDFVGALMNARMSASALLTSYEMLAQQADRLVQEMDYTFLYNAQRHVFHIGYNLENGPFMKIIMICWPLKPASPVWWLLPNETYRSNTGCIWLGP